MAGKRLYITIPERDAHLIRRLAMMHAECMGMWARRTILIELYRELERSHDLQDYDAELARAEREEVLHGRRG